MYTPAATATTSPVSTGRATTPASSNDSSDQDGTRDQLPKPAMTVDFHPDTFFNPVWTSGARVISYAQDGTVVSPETYVTEPYSGYNAEYGRVRRCQVSNTLYSRRFVGQGEKPWKNVAILEQDDNEWEAIQQRGWIGSGIWQPVGGLSNGQTPAPILNHLGPELVGTWPPILSGQPPNNEEKLMLVYTWPPKPNAS